MYLFIDKYHIHTDKLTIFLEINGVPHSTNSYSIVKSSLPIINSEIKEIVIVKTQLKEIETM